MASAADIRTAFEKLAELLVYRMFWNQAHLSALDIEISHLILATVGTGIIDFESGIRRTHST